MKKICAFLIYFTFNIGTALANDNCRPVDLRGEKLGPVRNQDDIGWCYAFGAADLLSYKFEKKISAAHLAVLFYQDVYKNLSPTADITREKFSQAHGGSVTSTAETANSNKVCTELDFPSEDHAFALAAKRENIAKKSPPSLIEAIKHLENAFEYFSTQKSASNESCTGCESLKKAQQFWPSLDFEKMRAVFLQKGQLGVFAIMNAMGTICETKKFKLPSFRSRSVSEDDDGKKTEIFKVLNQQLDRKNLVAMEYLAYFLIDKRYQEEYDGSRHVSSIVARRQGKQGCDYLIRNSWGASCKKYEEQGYECEQGNIWVSQKLLESKIISISYIQ